MGPEMQEVIPEASSNQDSPPIWPHSAQMGAVGLMLVLCVLLGWHIYAGSPYASRPTSVKPNYRVEVNGANELELETVRGIGPTLAKRIIDYRDAQGGFTSLDELRGVPGIGRITLERVRSRLYVEPRPTVLAERTSPEEPTVPWKPKKPLPSSYKIDVNHASHEELCRLPRIGNVLANRIIDARTNRPFRSVEDLARVSGIGPKTVQNLRPYVVFSAESASNE